MKEKRAFAFILISIIILSIAVISAPETEEEQIEKAYQCLTKKVTPSCTTITTEEAAFSLLALAYNESMIVECRDNLLLDKKKPQNCWGATASAGCDLRSTSLAILALDYIGEDTEDYTDWLLDQKQKSGNLDWYLEIDAQEATTCEVYLNDDEAIHGTFSMAEDKKLTGTSTCLKPAISNYFLQITSNCQEHLFATTCDKDFITTLLYKKDSTFFISSETHSGLANTYTDEQIKSVCLVDNNQCNYLGSLWGAFALDMTGNDISDILPYLNTEKDSHSNDFPSAFLYWITGQETFLGELKGLQRGRLKGYWNVQGGNIYYDTALALSALQSGTEVDKAKAYLLDKQASSGASEGCWQGKDIRDTAFILYSAWPKFSSGIPCTPDCTKSDGTAKVCGENGCGGICGTCPATQMCSNFSCITDPSKCVDDAGCNETEEQKCFGKVLKTCGNYDDDPCLEWSPNDDNDTIVCPKKCQAGVCTNKTTTTTTTPDCEDSGNYCILPGDCEAEDTFASNEYECYYWGVLCCGKPAPEETCSQKGGAICSSDKICSISLDSASDTNNCCLGSCIEEDDDDEEENECEARGSDYTCRTSSCRQDEESTSDDCEFSVDTCCRKTEKSSSWLIIILLLILIALVVLAIIYRNQLKIWLFRIKSKFKFGKGPKFAGRPPMPPPAGMPAGVPMRPRQIIPRGPSRPPARRPAPRSKDTVFEDTMKKLKDMTK